MFCHYLITRFNIIQSWYNNYTTVSGMRIQSEEWLAERFQLFEQYCLPSVAQQTTKDFVWLVLFSSETPEHYKVRLKGYHDICAAFTPLFLEPYGDENVLVRGYILEHTPNDQYTQVLTTRLDNDDAIRCDYLQLMQSAVTSDQADLFLNYRCGFQYDIHTRLAYIMDYPANHYVSRIETLSPDIQTVLCDHSDLDKLPNYRELEIVNGGGWIEVITGINAGNRLMKGAHPLLLPHSEQFFGARTLRISFLTEITYLYSIILYYVVYACRWTKRKIKKHILKRC